MRLFYEIVDTNIYARNWRKYEFKSKITVNSLRENPKNAWD